MKGRAQTISTCRKRWDFGGLVWGLQFSAAIVSQWTCLKPPPPQGLENTNKFRLHLLIIHCPLQCFFRSAEWKVCEREHTAIVSSASLRRRGLKQHCHAELKSSVREQQWHPRILGNAIQHLQRSIVRKTVVKGEKKVFCTIPNCFQIPPHFFFFLEQVVSKMECRHRRYFNRIIFFSLKCKTSGGWVKSETRPPPLSSLLPIYYTCDLLLFCTFIAQAVKPWVMMDGKWPNFSNNRPHSTAVFPSCHFCRRFNVRFSRDVFEYYPNFVPCYLRQAGLYGSWSFGVCQSDCFQKWHENSLMDFCEIFKKCW